MTLHTSLSIFGHLYKLNSPTSSDVILNGTQALPDSPCLSTLHIDTYNSSKFNYNVFLILFCDTLQPRPVSILEVAQYAFGYMYNLGCI